VTGMLLASGAAMIVTSEGPNAVTRTTSKRPCARADLPEEHRTGPRDNGPPEERGGPASGGTTGNGKGTRGGGEPQVGSNSGSGRPSQRRPGTELQTKCRWEEGPEWGVSIPSASGGRKHTRHRRRASRGVRHLRRAVLNFKTIAVSIHR
jgi:hypothetical protein